MMERKDICTGTQVPYQILYWILRDDFDNLPEGEHLLSEPWRTNRLLYPDSSVPDLRGTEVVTQYLDSLGTISIMQVPTLGYYTLTSLD